MIVIVVISIIIYKRAKITVCLNEILVNTELIGLFLFREYSYWFWKWFKLFSWGVENSIIIKRSVMHFLIYNLVLYIILLFLIFLNNWKKLIVNDFQILKIICIYFKIKNSLQGLMILIIYFICIRWRFINLSYSSWIGMSVLINSSAANCF